MIRMCCSMEKITLLMFVIQFEFPIPTYLITCCSSLLVSIQVIRASSVCGQSQALLQVNYKPMNLKNKHFLQSKQSETMQTFQYMLYIQLKNIGTGKYYVFIHSLCDLNFEDCNMIAERSQSIEVKRAGMIFCGSMC